MFHHVWLFYDCVLGIELGTSALLTMSAAPGVRAFEELIKTRPRSSLNGVLIVLSSRWDTAGIALQRTMQAPCEIRPICTLL